MLIRDASLIDGRRVDLRVDGGGIVAMAAALERCGGEPVLYAQGGAILQGLHDHHLHLFALAASRDSFDCAAARNEAELASGLRSAARGRHSLRAVNYHESIAGDIDRAWLDRASPDIAVRVQHRSGRLWILNSAALRMAEVGTAAAPVERVAGAPTGRIYDQDGWLRHRFRGAPPDLGRVGAMLAGRGVTGFTDATPANDLAFFDTVAAAQASGKIPQTIAVMGTADIIAAPRSATLFPVAIKLHLHEGDYPAPDAVMDMARAADAAGLRLAVHCVTVADLVFTLSLLQECGLAGRARIEHASVVPPDMVPVLADAGVTVVTQPNFIAERGDDYRRDIPRSEHDDLYRCASLRRAGVKVAAGSDAPFGHFDPWAAMDAAVTRRTSSGAILGRNEIVSPEAALGLFTTPLSNPGGAPRGIAVGQAADLCLLTQPWNVARRDLRAVTVRATLCRGQLIHGASDEEKTGRKVA